MGAEHKEVSTLLAWYVNETLTERDRQRVNAHVRDCAVCRDDLMIERRLYEGISMDAGVDFVPAAALKRLNTRLDQLEVSDPTVPSTRSSVGMTRWLGLVAASIAVMAVGLHEWRSRPALYRTVTSADLRSPDEVIRAVFSPTITLVELQAILDEAQLQIMSGPTEAGVYSLAAKSTRPTSTSLALLRRHATVRFAESTRPDVNPGGSP